MNEKYGMSHGSKHGKIDPNKAGFNVGGYRHGGVMKDGNFNTPFPLDTSDHKMGGEYGKDMPVKATGAAGGYKSST